MKMNGGNNSKKNIAKRRSLVKGRRAFTLIEVIAVVVVVAILALLIIPMISKYIKQGKDEYNKQLETQLMLVGKDYYAANPVKLPKDGGITQVWLPFLKTNNYTSEEFKDADGGLCTKSYVRVKNNGGTYEYIPCLNCENYKTNNSRYCILDDSFINTDTGEEEVQTLPPTCTIKFDSYTGGWATGAQLVTINGNVDPLTNIVNYMIGDDIITPDASGIGKATINKNGKVTAIIQDSAGKTGQCTTDKELKIDTSAPVCTWAGAYKDRNGTTKATYPERYEKIYYKLNCTDAESGIVVDPTASSVIRSNTSVFTSLSLVNTTTLTNGKSYTFETTAGSDGWARLSIPAGVVKDAVGHSNKAVSSEQVYVYTPSSGSGGGGGGYVPPPADNDGPTCTITMKKADGSSYYEGDWSNQNVTLNATCSDPSGVRSIDYSPSQTITNSGVTNVTVTATDNSGNSSDYYKTVQIDKVKPSCSLTMKKSDGTTYTNNTWTNKNVRVDISCSDTGGSSLNDGYFTSSEATTKYRQYHTVDIEGNNKISVYAIDNAGNEYTASKTIKLDKTPPKLDSLPCYNGKQSGFMQYKYPWTDGGSGLQVIKSKHCYTSIPAKYDSSWSCAYKTIAERSWDDRSSQFEVGNKIDSIYMDYKALPNSSNTEAIVNTKWHVCDIAGNCEEYGLYIDKLNYSSGKYTSSNRSRCSGAVDLTTYTRKVCTRKKNATYGWVNTTGSVKNCNVGTDCCTNSLSRTCSSASDVGKLKFTGCDPVTRYKFARKQTCQLSSGSYKWVTTDSTGGTCSGTTKCCSTSTTCNKTNKGKTRYNGCTAVTSYTYTTRKECQETGSSYTDWTCTTTTGQTVCTAKTGDLEKVTCTEE